MTARLVLPAIAIGAALLGLACSGRGGAPGRMWTEAQAESISVVRGLPVRVQRCRGLGRGRETGKTIVYARFSCLAGARLAGQPIDTVAITYLLRPLGPYAGPSSRCVLTDVHFGGLGVP